MKTITITLNDKSGLNGEAWLFAQFLKRITYQGVADCAVDKAETESMLEIIEKIRSQLAKQGIAPR